MTDYYYSGQCQLAAKETESKPIKIALSAEKITIQYVESGKVYWSDSIDSDGTTTDKGITSSKSIKWYHASDGSLITVYFDSVYQSYDVNIYSFDEIGRPTLYQSFYGSE
ncbi:MAG: hypothetical protein DRJ13_12395 [Bacteroidetes bacterium]|nr:MAG: hypothetical protein DRJ13_12395 [Bacteroidota bacterium]